MLSRYFNATFYVFISSTALLIVIDILNLDSPILLNILLAIWAVEILWLIYKFVTYSYDGLKINKLFSSSDFYDLTYKYFFPRFKMPKDRAFFKKSIGNSCINSKLPYLDLNDYDFDGTNIIFANFHKDTILSSDNDFFQKIKNKNINGVTLPIGDYSKVNFKGVNIRNVKFRDGSTLPSDVNLFQYSNNPEVPFRVRLPKECSETIHYYDFSGIKLYLIEKLNITREQYMILAKQLSKDSMDNSFIVID